MQQDISVVPKSQTPERILANYEAINVSLSADDIAKLNKLDKNKQYTLCDGWNVL